jgi:hypothetical protein
MQELELEELMLEIEQAESNPGRRNRILQLTHTFQL